MPGPYAQLRALRSDDAEANARAAALLKGYWDLRALAHYRKAYEINLQTDLRRPGRGPAADSQISAEAGEQVLAILKDHPETARENELRDVQANVQKMRSGGMAMTPIVFAMPGAAPARDLGDLVDSSKRVGFDLAGDGIARTWPWLKDGTALLVWDPSGSGKIESGKQLFGSRTWWVCFRNGYEALSVLDDNHDGRLAGAELQGIAVWIDRNGNGISEPGEVVSLQQAGIASIAVTAAETAGVLANPEGITFTSGTTVPTFDWVADQVSGESKAPGQ
jgi:hypothetical protein